MKRSVSNIKMDKNPAPTRRMKVSDNSDSPKAPTSDEVKLICDFFDSLEAKTAMYDSDDVKEAKKCLLEGMNINDIDLDVQSDTPYKGCNAIVASCNISKGSQNI